MELFRCVGPCGEEKSADGFYYKQPSNKRYAFCKACHTARTRKRDGAERDKARDQSVVAKRYRLYGITDEQFWTMYAEQQGCCAACKTSFDERPWNIDHCHDEKHVRGLLCENCNKALGLLGESAEAVAGLLNYISAPPRWDVSTLGLKLKMCTGGEPGCQRPPVPNRRMCQPCRNAQEKARRVERKDRLRSTPCAEEGCGLPRHETPSQVLPWCKGHRDARLRPGLVLEEPRYETVLKM